MNPSQDTPPGKVPLDYLMYLREIKNVDLAAQIGTSQQEVSRYRKGLRPTEERRKKIAEFFGVTQADLGWETEQAGV